MKAYFFIGILLLGQLVQAKGSESENKRIPASVNLPYQFVSLVSGEIAENLYTSLGSAEEADEGNFVKSATKLSCTKFPAKGKKNVTYSCQIRLQLLDTNGTLELLSP